MTTLDSLGYQYEFKKEQQSESIQTSLISEKTPSRVLTAVSRMSEGQKPFTQRVLDKSILGKKKVFSFFFQFIHNCISF